MSSVDFVLYCAGSGLLMLSAAGAFRLLTGDRKPPAVPIERPQAPPPAEEPLNDMGLVDRLRRFQDQRFASPILRRQLEREGYTPTPGEPGGRRVVPPIGQLRTLSRPKPGRVHSVPKQPTKETSNVVTLPLRQQKPDDTTKKD